MILSIHQPAYLPWLGYYDRIAKSDIFIILDTVQYQKNSFQNRNKIRIKNGWSWITVPVKTKKILYDKNINQIEIDYNQNWNTKHLKSIKQAYVKSKNFEKIFPLLENILIKKWPSLADLSYETTICFFDILEIDTKIIRTSELKPFKENKSDLILEICKYFDTTKYLSGPIGKDYLNEKKFENESISIDYHNFIHPSYVQTYKGFEANMSIIDLLMNVEKPANYFE
ncbi:MAG: hypothetical protein CFH01_00539 [Alphaproteobacteria bacterium MarineAlpha2_Bin1]|nr:MAG: hypothetical protein CFH01_00539 [Alphaproteobacteria bacterium MarineAlpha2_Bin1]